MSAAKSADALKRKAGNAMKCQWFTANFANADVAGFDLTEGRVSRVTLFYKSPAPTRVAGLDKQLASLKPEHVIVERTEIKEDGRAASIAVVFRADPVDWYLSRHKASDAVAKALHEHRYLPGMTDDEMDVAGDGPGQYRVTFRIKWHSGGTARVVPKGEVPVSLIDPNQKRQETLNADSKAEAKDHAERAAAVRDEWQVESVERIPAHPVEP